MLADAGLAGLRAVAGVAVVARRAVGLPRARAAWCEAGRARERVVGAGEAAVGHAAERARVGREAGRELDPEDGRVVGEAGPLLADDVERVRADRARALGDRGQHREPDVVEVPVAVDVVDGAEVAVVPRVVEDERCELGPGRHEARRRQVDPIDARTVAQEVEDVAVELGWIGEPGVRREARHGRISGVRDDGTAPRRMVRVHVVLRVAREARGRTGGGDVGALQAGPALIRAGGHQVDLGLQRVAPVGDVDHAGERVDGEAGRVPEPGAEHVRLRDQRVPGRGLRGRGTLDREPEQLPRLVHRAVVRDRARRVFGRTQADVRAERGVLGALQRVGAAEELRVPAIAVPAMRQPSTPNAKPPPLRFVDSVGGSSVVCTIPR